MPDLLTPQVLAAAGPLVLETLFKHFLGPKVFSSEKGKEKEDLMYEEAFILMKTFLEMATKYPCAALQRFGQVRTPSPPWVAVYRLLIPHQTLNEAATHMITALGGEEMAYKIAGGHKWWQVRAGHGLEAEWIVMKKDWKGVVEEEKREKERAKERTNRDDGGEADEDEDGEFRPEMDRLRCMLYIHGGAYYWGSINTHRYTIWRYARKMHGRCFAVNYRKTPQYPFPCALHDCLAAYMYLIKPPPGAEHRPVDPKSIILAGDSAGGGLVLALLQILRDTDGLELPAGAVLISPWSDLTHSFPSILQNTATDVVPPYGFIHKPSSLWPPPPPMLTEEVQTRLRSRVKEAVSRVRHHPQHAAEAHQTVVESLEKEMHIPTVQEATTIPDKLKTSKPSGGLEKSRDQSESDLHPLADKSENQHPEPQTEPTHNPSRANPADLFSQLVEQGAQDTRPSTLAQCTTPLKLTVKGEEVIVDTQIQLYATNAQLCHPWVSPILGYLGGLPPLFVMCGDQEVLRDEIIYVAHKAANPDTHPLREDVKAMMPSMRGIEDKHGPTNVHLQVYDGTCHDLPLLSMTRQARGAFRAIASFARYVTPSAPGSRYISRSRPNTPKASTNNFASQLNSQTQSRTDSESQFEKILPSTPVTDNQQIMEKALTSPPAVISPREPAATSVSFTTPKKPKVPTLDLNLGNEITPTTIESPGPLSPLAHPESDRRDSLTPAPTPFNRNVSFASSVNSDSGNSTPASRRQSLLPPTPVRSGFNGNGSGSGGGSTLVPGDESGNRFEKGEEFLQDGNAKEGEAGWAGIYKDDVGDPFTDHMIRERVSTSGVLRPLEPASELSALQMPQDEIGVIKEGPAMRYINGQALWDKKYRRAAKTVQRKREKNLKIAHKEGSKIGVEWMKRAAEKEKHAFERKRHPDHARDVAAAKEGEEQEHRHEHGSDAEEERDLMDQSWSWTWALNGEAPPPSAVVSRRDIPEARQLALMADRLDSSHGTSFHGLSLWVGLAAFFSSSTERNKAGEAVRAAREVGRLNKSKGKSSASAKHGNGNAGARDDPWASDNDDDGSGESEEEGEDEGGNIDSESRTDGVRDHKELVKVIRSSQDRRSEPEKEVVSGTGNGSAKTKVKGKTNAVEGERPASRKKGLPKWFTFWKKRSSKTVK